MPTALITSYAVNQTTESNSVTIKYIITDTVAMTYNDAMLAMPSGASVETIDGVDCYLKSRNITVVEGSLAKVWEGEANWSDESSNSSALSFIAKDLSTTTVGTDFWRIANPPSDVNSPSSGDIGGTPCDSYGDPITVFVPQQEMTITNFTIGNNATNMIAAVGRRNSTAYNGAPIGYLVFAGATSRRVSTLQYETTYKMVYDYYGHCRQVAMGDEGGVKLATASGMTNASLVVWVQPFPATINFNSLGIVL